MHLSTTQMRALGDVMRLLAEANDGDALREALALPLLELLAADQYVSMVWNAEEGRFERVTAVNVSAASLRRWDEYYRLVDPLTFPMMERRRPTIATQVVPQPALARTEFFNDFLQPEHMHWGINVYFFDRQAAVGDLRVWRKRDRGNFEANDVELLRMVEPAVAAALGRLHWERHAAPAGEATERAEELLQRTARRASGRPRWPGWWPAAAPTSRSHAASTWATPPCVSTSPTPSASCRRTTARRWRRVCRRWWRCAGRRWGARR